MRIAARASRLARPALVASVLLSQIAYASIGPATVRRDRVDYADAIADAAKREALLNIVKLRYGDTRVDQLVAGYTVEGRLRADATLFRGDFELSDDVRFGAEGVFSDRPTVTYTPIRGSEFARVMLTPIPPSDLFAAAATGTAELVLGLGVQSMNRLRNRQLFLRRGPDLDPEFARALDLIDELRRDGRIGFSFGQRGESRNVSLVIAEGGDADPRVRELLGLLDVDPEARAFPIIFGFGLDPAGGIAVFTRSLIEILGEIGAEMEVPEGDVEDGRTFRTPAVSTTGLPRIQVNTGRLRPLNAYVAIDHLGHWFYIDETDFESKTVFSALMLILTLVERTGGDRQLPVITIPTG
jgi:hypothetical protein